jgi:sarcosine oxidase
MNVVVIGAGAFGGWTAIHLLRSGAKVTLIDAWGPGNSRASSGGETRIIRAIYGTDASSVRFAVRSLQLWKEHEERWKTRLYLRTGFLFMAGRNDDFIRESRRTLQSEQVQAEELSRNEAERRFPAISFEGIESILYEEDAGALMARENCRTVVEHFVAEGGRFITAAVQLKPSLNGDLKSLELSNHEVIKADGFVFACGPWMGELFPQELGHLIRPTRQDVLFFGARPGDNRFGAGQFPCWADRTSPEVFYGIPDVHHRGFKIAADVRGPLCDPNQLERIVENEVVGRTREYVALRFPDLRNAPLLEARVCQYENTPDFGFVLDRHPQAANVWLAGGGSGHGYKHGPAIGEYVSRLVQGLQEPESHFSLARFSQQTAPKSGSPFTAKPVLAHDK